MSVRYDEKTQKFTLETEYPVHLYYGKKGGETGVEYINPYKSFSPYFEEHGLEYSPDVGMAEYSYFGSGDFRVTPLRIQNRSGDSVTHFIYKNYKISNGRKELSRLPFATADDDTQTLELTLSDSVSGCVLRLYYTVCRSRKQKRRESENREDNESYARFAVLRL